MSNQIMIAVQSKEGFGDVKILRKGKEITIVCESESGNVVEIHPSQIEKILTDVEFFLSKHPALKLKTNHSNTNAPTVS